MMLSIIVPARNEAGNIGPTVDAIRHRLAAAGIRYEINVVDDGSSDTTCAEVREREAIDPGVRLQLNDGPHGFGHAVRFGRS